VRYVVNIYVNIVTQRRTQRTKAFTMFATVKKYHTLE